LAAKALTEAGAGLTVSVEVPLALPVGPVQIRVYEFTPAVLRVPVLTADPVVGCAPPHDPEAVHAEALVAFQVKTAEPPATIEPGLTPMATVTGGGVVAVLAATLTL
jgi:hypothetical protein